MGIQDAHLTCCLTIFFYFSLYYVHGGEFLSLRKIEFYLSNIFELYWQAVTVCVGFL